MEQTYNEVAAQRLLIDKDAVEIDKSFSKHDKINVKVAAQRLLDKDIPMVTP